MLKAIILASMAGGGLYYWLDSLGRAAGAW